MTAGPSRRDPFDVAGTGTGSATRSNAGCGCALVLILLLLAVGAAPSFFHPFGPEPHAVTPPVRSSAVNVTLDPTRPTATGHLSITYRLPQNGLSLGVSASLPEPVSSAAAEPTSHSAPTRVATRQSPTSPAATQPFVDPLVRLTFASASGSSEDCTAPCGLDLGYPACDQQGTCVVTGTLVLELRSSETVAAAVTVSAAASSQLEQQPPDVTIDLAFGAPSLTPAGG